MQRLKIGDLVQVVAGKDKGKRGKVTKLLKNVDRVVVEGVNMVVRHQRPNQRNTEGGRLEQEAALHVSNVMPIDAETDKPTRTKSAVGEDGKKSRVAASGNQLKQG
jgi:large subunit ribosomal protein L24